MQLRTTLAIKIVLSVLMIASVVFTGCNGKKNSQEDPVLKAYRLIDEQRTDEAIELLETQLAKDPENSEFKVVLASAYAHKGGIKIQKLVSAINQSEKVKELNLKLAEVNGQDNLSRKVNVFALNAASILTKFAGFFEAYASVPVISAEQATYLRHSIYLLNEMGNKIKAEDALYRAVLGVVLFKHVLSENLVGEFFESKSADDAKCQIDLGNINDTLVSLGKLLIDISNDIGFANPNQADDMKRFSNEVSESVSNLTLATTSVMVLDEVSNTYLRQAAVQNGFGKIVRCDRK